MKRLALKLTILQAPKVVLFCPQKWSGEWVEFNPKIPGRHFGASHLFSQSEFLVSNEYFQYEKMSSDTEMSEISEISSSPEDEETSEGAEEDVEVIYSQIRPYQDEPLAEDAEENTEENEVDEDGLTPAALEARYEREVPVNSWSVYSIFYRRLLRCNTRL